MAPTPCTSPRAPHGVARLPRWGLTALVTFGLWLAPGEDAHAQARRRRTQREVAADSVTPAPAYGSAARGLARERRRGAAPVVRRRGPPPAPKNDSGDVEAVEDVETASVEGSPDGPSTWWGDAWPVWDRVLDGYTARPVRRHTVNTYISHRSSYGIWEKPLWNAFGIDGFNNVGLGVRVGIFDRLDLGAMRFGNTLGHDTYEFDVRGQLLEQAHFHLDLGLRLGFSWFAQEQRDDASGLFAELMVGRLLFDRVYAGLNLLYHSSSSGAMKTDTDAKASVALQAMLAWRINGGLSLAMEVTPSIAGYKARTPVVTFGPRFITNRHTFAIVLSDTPYFSTDAIVANAAATRPSNPAGTTFKSPMKPSSLRLGFHITREL